MVGFCSGTIAGLVAATPCSGYISPWASLIVGVLSGSICNYATKGHSLRSPAELTSFDDLIPAKFILRIDDGLDLFAEHAVGGIIGLLANALFGSKEIVAFDGITKIPGGWIDHNWKQLYIQFAYVCAVCAYDFVVTALICKALDLIPGLQLRATAEAEEIGMDEDQVRVLIREFESFECIRRYRLESLPRTMLNCVVISGTHQRSQPRKLANWTIPYPTRSLGSMQLATVTVCQTTLPVSSMVIRRVLKRKILMGLFQLWQSKMSDSNLKYHLMYPCSMLSSTAFDIYLKSLMCKQIVLPVTFRKIDSVSLAVPSINKVLLGL
jgi:hypothetical protein